MILIPTNESVSQMTLIQMCRAIRDLLTDYIPYAERVETASTDAESAKTAAETAANAAESAKTAAENSATAAAAEYAKIEPTLEDALGQIEFTKSTGVSAVEYAVNTGVASIENAITTVLNTEV